MRRPICVNCNLELRVKKNSVGVETMTTDGPCQYFHADLWECPECGLQIISGFGAKPIVEHYQPNYAEYIAAEKQLTPVFRAWFSKQERQKFTEGSEALAREFGI